MDNKNNSDISPEELLKQLKANIELDNIEEPEEIQMPDIDDKKSGLSPEEIFKRGTPRSRGAEKQEEENSPTEQEAAPEQQEDAPEEDIQEQETSLQEVSGEDDTENEAGLEKDFSEPAAGDVSENSLGQDVDSDNNTSGTLSDNTDISEAEAQTLQVPCDEAYEEALRNADTDKAPTTDLERIPTQEFNQVEDDNGAAGKAASDTAEFESLAEEDDTGEVDVDALMKKYLSEAEYNEVLATRKDPADTDLALHISEAEEYVSSIENQIEKEGPSEPVTETQKTIQEMDLSSIGDEEFDETDVNLMIAFGMKDELEEKLGDENAQMVKEALEKDAQAFGSIKREENVPDEIGKDMEFVSSSQIREVFDIYKKQYRNILVKYFASFFLLAAVFLYENFTAIGGKFPLWLDPQVFPVIHSMVSLQLLLLSCALVIRPIIDGIKAFFTGKPTSDSVLSLLVIFSVAYHIAICFLYDGTVMMFCNVPVLLFINLTILSRMLTLKRDIFSFNIVSSKRTKHIISKIPEDEAELEHEAFDDYIDEDASVFRIGKTSFVDGFFRRTREYSGGKTVLMAIIPICIAISAFFLLYIGFTTKNWYQGIRSAYLALMLAAPLSVFLTFSYPLYRAAKIAFDMGGAIIGESSLENYSDAAAVSFDDKDVFPSAKAKVKSIKIYGNNRIDRVIYNTASLFKVLGGPLCDVFNIATKDFECSDDVEIVDITDDGVEAVISGKHIFYGKASYLHKNNFEPIYDIDDERIEFSGEACISYLVCNDEVAAKIYVSYGIDPDFVAISKQLYRAGMCIGIKSFDPNIDDNLISKHINLSKYAVKVLKCRYLSEKTQTQERCDSGIVSKKNAKSLLKTLALCDKVNSVTKISLVIKALSILLAFGITVFMMFRGVQSYDFAGLYIAAYQLFWIIPILGISVLNIKK